jgi:ABC-type uncharacterized transport system ATPase subunit
VLLVSDRILVMREGRLAAEFTRAEATEERIIAAATGQAAGQPTGETAASQATADPKTADRKTADRKTADPKTADQKPADQKRADHTTPQRRVP